MYRFAFAALVGAGWLTGCGGPTANQNPISPTQLQLLVPAKETGARSRARSSIGDPLLWATDQLDNAVTAFDLARRGSPAVITITDGINNPRGVTIDGQGTLYVASAADGNNGYVTEYPAGQTTPSVTLTGLSDPNDIAIDSDGAVYVSNAGEPASIAVYKPGRTKPSRYIIGKLIQIPWQIFFDSAGSLYLADDVTGVSVMKRGASRFTSLHLKRLGMLPRAIALDPLNGDLFLGDGANSQSGHHSTRVYAPRERDPKYHLPVGSGVHGIAIGTIGSDTDVFVPPYGTAESIYVFHHHGRRPFKQIANSLRGINGVAFQPATAPQLSQRR